MIDFGYLKNRIRDVKPADYLSVFPMSAALLLRPFYRSKYSDAWLVCEEPAEARDNGYHFFKYMCEQQPQQSCFYAIKSKSVDAPKVKSLGKAIEYGSLQHWLAYFLCRYNISSQKGGKPNAAMCAFMELSGRFKPKNVFLQHGITCNKGAWLFADKCRFTYFLTAAYPEHEMIVKNFGYDEDVVQLTGFPRYDALDNSMTNKRQIVIMPTWRYWFNLKSKTGNEVRQDFFHSQYLMCWLKFLNNERLGTLIKEKDLKVVFYLHRNMQKYIDAFGSVTNDIEIASWKKYDIQDVLKQSALLVTDYSSVFFDMVYMKKPVLFYQFDEVEYRKYQYEEGWFDYHNNKFSASYQNVDDLVSRLAEYADNGFEVDERFMEGFEELFKYSDRDNCRRIYKLLAE